jgi:hypothetical protein
MRLSTRLWPLLALLVALAGCAGTSAASFDPLGPCTADGKAPGAYPELEALVPAVYLDEPAQRVDSGRNCTTENLGALTSHGISEVRFAGGTWSFGAERSAVLAVFRSEGLDADAMADFYGQSAETASRTDILARSTPIIAGRPGYRLDTKTGERVQTVVVWPAMAEDSVDVVITNDLPEARIQDAIDAFEGR